MLAISIELVEDDARDAVNRAIDGCVAHDDLVFVGHAIGVVDIAGVGGVGIIADLIEVVIDTHDVLARVAGDDYGVVVVNAVEHVVVALEGRGLSRVNDNRLVDTDIRIDGGAKHAIIVVGDEAVAPVGDEGRAGLLNFDTEGVLHGPGGIASIARGGGRRGNVGFGQLVGTVDRVVAGGVLESDDVVELRLAIDRAADTGEGHYGLVLVGDTVGVVSVTGVAGVVAQNILVPGGGVGNVALDRGSNFLVPAGEDVTRTLQAVHIIFEGGGCLIEEKIASNLTGEDRAISTIGIRHRIGSGIGVGVLVEHGRARHITRGNDGVPALGAIAAEVAGSGLITNGGSGRHRGGCGGVGGQLAVLVEGEHMNGVGVRIVVPVAVDDLEGHTLLVDVGNTVRTFLLRVVLIDLVFVPLGGIGGIAAHLVSNCRIPACEDVAVASGVGDGRSCGTGTQVGEDQLRGRRSATCQVVLDRVELFPYGGVGHGRGYLRSEFGSPTREGITLAGRGAVKCRRIAIVEDVPVDLRRKGIAIYTIHILNHEAALRLEVEVQDVAILLGAHVIGTFVAGCICKHEGYRSGTIVEIRRDDDRLVRTVVLGVSLAVP